MTHQISVALCTHNGVRFVAEQVRSICMQTLPPSEIILSDDASSDETVSLARETVGACLALRPGIAISLNVLQNDPALRITKNFEQATRACRGNLIALCDQDDVWHADRLRRMAEEFSVRADLSLLHSDARLIDDEGRPLGTTLFQALEVKAFELDLIHSGRALDVLLRRNLATGATTMFRSTLLKRALPFPTEWLHDEWLAAVAAITGHVDVLEQPLVDYRQHAANEVGARRPTLLQNFRRAFAARGEKQHQRLQRAQRLLDRLRDWEASEDVITKVNAKVAHQRFRAGLPSWRPARVYPVVRQAMTGRYQRYDRGVQAVVADLFESPGEILDSRAVK